VVDDNEIVRMGVRGLLCNHPQWEICGEAENGADAISKVAELSPDVVILDLIMPVISGIEAATRIRRISPSTKIVFFSIHDTPTTARMVGADAFVSKSSAAQDLVLAINNVLQTLGNPSGPLPVARDQLTN
jgi:DNA-binding NarL/FixJ family response regulator